MLIQRRFISSLFAYLILICLLHLVENDCPISRYQSEFRIGQINVQLLAQSPNETLKDTYTYGLEVPFQKIRPSVIIGITGYDFTPAQKYLQFSISLIQEPILSQLKFMINSVGMMSQSRVFSFRFMTVQKGFTLVQAGSVSGDISSNSKLTSPLNVSTEKLSSKPQIIVFWNGFKSNYTSAISTLNIQLGNAILKGNDFLQIEIDIKSTPLAVQVLSVSVSFLIYNRQQFYIQNQILLQTLQFDASIKQLNFVSIQYADLTFYGLSMLNIKPTQINVIDLTLSEETLKLQIQGSLNNLFKVTIWQSYVKNSYICSFCKDGSIVYEGKYCVSTCPKDYVVQSGGIFSNECKKCQISLLRIPDNSNTKCICAVQYFQSPINNECVVCHFSCLTCVGQAFNDCLTCDTNTKVTFRQLTKTSSKSLTGQCNCPLVGFYQEDQNVKCQKCHSQCKTCTGPLSSDCLECNSQRLKNQFNLCECKPGYSSQIDGSCACLNPKFQVNGACMDPLNSCGMNQFQVIQNIKSNNGKGNNNKTSTSSKSCQCKNGFYKVKGQCVDCGQNKVYNEKKGRCECLKDADQLKNGSCIVCGINKKFNKKTQTCECKNKNQNLNNQGDCISCPKKSLLFKDKCICINNYFMNSKGKCQKCKKSSDNPTCKKSSDHQL